MEGSGLDLLCHEDVDIETIQKIPADEDGKDPFAESTIWNRCSRCMEAECKRQYDEEIVQVFASLVLNAFLEYHHRYANKKDTNHADDSRYSREMVNEEVQVSLVCPAKDVEKCVEKSIDKDDPAAVDVQLM